MPYRISRLTRSGWRDRIRHRDGRAAGHPEQGEAIQAGRGQYGLEIPDACLDREVVDVPVGHPEASLVVPNDGRERAELVEEVAPHRTLPVVLEVAEPARDDDQWRPVAVDGIGEAHAVRGTAETDLLLDTGRSRTGCRRCGMHCHGAHIVRVDSTRPARGRSGLGKGRPYAARDAAVTSPPAA